MKLSSGNSGSRTRIGLSVKMKVLYFTFVALLSMFLYKEGETMVRSAPVYQDFIDAYETATGQCNGVTESTLGGIKLAADQTCRKAFTQLDLAAMNVCPGWEEAQCRLIPGQTKYECTIMMSFCWTDLRPRTLLDCTYRTLANELREQRRYSALAAAFRGARGSGAAGASGSGYAGASGSGYAGASGSSYAGNSGSGAARASGSGYTRASGSGSARASGSGYARASGSGAARASGSSRGSLLPFRIPSLPPTPENPSIPEDPTLLYDPDFTPDAFSYQDPALGRGPTPRNPLPPQYRPAPAFSSFGGSLFHSLPPTSQPYTPADSNLLRVDETFGVDDVPYATLSIDANPAEQVELAGKRRKGKSKLFSGLSFRRSRANNKGETYTCQEPGCNKSFNTEDQFKRHMRHHDSFKQQGWDEPKQYACPYDHCLKSYKHSVLLTKHIRSVHEGKSTQHRDKPAPPRAD